MNYFRYFNDDINKNPDPNFIPPASVKNEAVKIIHAKDGVYDVYVNGKWVLTRGSADNVFSYLSEELHTFTLEFEDEYHYG